MKDLKVLQLMSSAADSIADGDLVSGMIRGCDRPLLQLSRGR